MGPSIPNRSSTGTAWTSGPPVLARIQSVKKTDKGADADQIQPVYVGEVPQVVHNAQANILQRSAAGDALLAGGMDKRTLLSWIICGNQLFIWSYISAEVSKKCVVLDIPYSAFENKDISIKSGHANHWMVCVVKWDPVSSDKVLGQCNSVGIVICNQKTQAVVYWPDIYSETGNVPIVSLPTPLDTYSPGTWIVGMLIQWLARTSKQGPKWEGQERLCERGFQEVRRKEASFFQEPMRVHAFILLQIFSDGILLFNLYSTVCSGTIHHHHLIFFNLNGFST